MANIKVSEMPSANSIEQNDLFMIVQDGKNKKVEANIIKSLVRSPKIYTVRKQISSSSSALERLNDNVGLVANATHDGSAVVNDFDNIYPWSDIISYNYDTKGQRITAFYGDPTFDFSGNNGQVLTRIPKFWYKIWKDGGYYYYSIANNKVDGYIESQQFSVGRYTVSGSSSGVFSRSGQAPFVNYNITNARTYARNVGDRFGILDYHIFLISLLYIVEYADYNSQNKLGKGNISNTVALTSGGCDSLGMKSGCLVNDSKHSVIYRGIEDIYGNIWQFIDGLNIKDHIAYVSYNSSDYAVDKFDGSYKPVGYTTPNTNGWVKELGYDNNNPLISLAAVIGGSESTYVTDYYWQNSGNRIAHFGGGWGSGTNCGFWFWNLNNESSLAYAGSGSRLLLNQ
nr:MAG TPA: tail collar fiber protein [Caudoviricetes sp.]